MRLVSLEFRALVRASLATIVCVSAVAQAQSGVSDDRVSLPDGPGSIGGVGENVDLNPNMGTASFKVDIRVPQGATTVMTPHLALSYSSGMGMGMVGLGWDLESNTIERTISKGLPEYTTADHFALDGGRELVSVGTLDGTRVYRERFEGSFVRYRWRDFGAGAAGYWTAEYPDGHIGYFGATSAGVVVPTARVASSDGKTFRYHLVELVDTVGRRIAYKYTKDNGWVLLDEIQYGFSTQPTPRFSVRLGYETRSDIRSDATPGYEIRLTKRLNEIRVLSQDEVIRRYTLTYEADGASGGLSRLQKVSEFGRSGGKLPIEHTFSYSRTLTGACTVGCEKPFMVDMGVLPGGVNIQTGRASLLDINGDSLPDIVSSSADGKHTFHISKLSTEGRPSFAGSPVASTKTTTGSSFILGSPGVQLLDVNGDGFTDIVDQVNGKALCNTGIGDWSGTSCLASPGQLPTLADDPQDAASNSDPLGMRFFDFDNDKRIDLLQTPTQGSAFVSRNTGTGYTRLTVDSIGAAFDAEALELNDLNGDGLQDPTMLVASGSGSELRYRLNLGFGHWGPWTTIAVSDLSSAQADSASMEDLDGDGLTDIVLVSGNRVSFWRNRNGGRFDAREDIVTADVDGQIPETTSDETVLFADMNGNGTDDVVWISSSGHVRFLELFPVRPNLLSRIENGIGWVRTIAYGTSIAQRARDFGTSNEWKNPLPESMNVVTALDDFVTLTGSDDGSGVHERHELSYFAGFYDGEEKSFRGYERVYKRLVSDPTKDGQEAGLELLEYDVGRTDPYRNGLQIRTAEFGGPANDVPIRERRSEFSDCPVEGVSGANPPVRFVCQTAAIRLEQEGADPSKWVTIRTESVYDGYGNVKLSRELGVENLGAPEGPLTCGPCTGPDALRSGACGATCTGDERFTATTYVVPGADTGGAWLLHLPVRSTTGGTEDASEVSATSFFYDGPDFVGLAAGKATRGLLSRSTTLVAAGQELPQTRNAWDASGNLIATLDPNGAPEITNAHRRDYAYDAYGLRVTRVTVQVGDTKLVQNVSYDSSFAQPSETTGWVAMRGADAVTSRNASSFSYDEFGRPTAIVRPGDTADAPTETFEYHLGSPVTRVVAHARSTTGADPDMLTVQCQDGRGRTVQTRTRISENVWQVDGFVVRNSRGAAVRAYQPFLATSGDCDTKAPANVAFTAFQLDAVGRPSRVTMPDDSIYGTPSIRRTVYEPLSTVSYDAEDNDASRAHANTPRRTRMDGLDRTIAEERLLTADGTPATYRLFYDALGRLARVDDPAGNGRVSTFDLAGRVLTATEPNSGKTTYVFDAASNVTSSTDARGRVVKSEYDGMNRLVARWDDSDKAGTLETNVYDALDACRSCRNGAGQLVRTTYPLPGAKDPGMDEFGYDTRTRPALLRRTLEGHAFETTTEYDATGKPRKTTYPDGQVLSYTYDGARRTVGLGGVVSAATYDARGALATVTHANGVSARYAYDAIMRPSALSYTNASGAFLSLGVTHDRAGNITGVSDDSKGSANHPSHAAQHTYDAWYRVTQSLIGPAASAETLTFTYDTLDNLTSRTSSLGAASPAHIGTFAYAGAGPNAVTTVGSATYAYDAAGGLTKRGDLNLAWDHLGRLTGATQAEHADATFAYASSGERVMKLENGGVAYFAAPNFVVRDGVSHVYATFGGTTVARLRSTALATTVLTDRNADSRIDVSDAWLGRADADASRLLRASARRLLVEAAPLVHLHTDVQGSVVAATGADGAVLAERAFYPFGLERAATGFVDERGYTGQEFDESTGFVHFNHRTLDPIAGRWTQSDPAFRVLTAEKVGALGESTTGYAYVANNPVSFVDPTGLGLGKLVFPHRTKKEKGFDGAKSKAAIRIKGQLTELASQHEGIKSRIAEHQQGVDVAWKMVSEGHLGPVTNRPGTEHVIVKHENALADLHFQRKQLEAQHADLNRHYEETVQRHTIKGGMVHSGGTTAGLAAFAAVTTVAVIIGVGAKAMFGGGGGADDGDDSDTDAGNGPGDMTNLFGAGGGK